MFRCSTLVAAGTLVVGLSLFLVAPAEAQVPRDVMGVKGKVNEVGNGLIAITDAMNKQQLVQVLDTTKVSIEGTAEGDFLGPGVFVQFSARVNGKGEVQGELSDLMVCDVNDTARPTFAPEDPALPNPFKDRKDKDLTAPFFVRGRVMNNKAGKLQIAAPGVQLKATLAAAPKIKVAVRDYSLAQPGDDITVDGKEVQPAHIVATVVQINMAKPLAPKKKMLPMRKRPAKAS